MSDEPTTEEIMNGLLALGGNLKGGEKFGFNRYDDYRRGKGHQCAVCKHDWSVHSVWQCPIIDHRGAWIGYVEED